MADKVLSFTMNKKQFDIFTDCVKELYSIDNTITIVFKNDITVLYSFVGKDMNDIHAFKCTILKTDELLNKSIDIEDILLILKDGKKFLRNIVNFNDDFKKELNIKISTNNDNVANYIHLSSDRLKLKEISGDPSLIDKQITKEDIEHLINKKSSLFNFDITESDLIKIKKLSLIETINDVLYINISNNNILIGETKWELKVGEINKPNLNISFPKKYFNTLKSQSTKIYVFETYILVSDENTDLMIVLETTI